MKFFVSLPIHGYCMEKCRERASKVKAMIERRGHQAVTPFDALAEQSPSYARCIASNIEALIGCDAIFRCSGWSSSPSCALESECAHIYNKRIYDHIKQVEPTNNSPHES